MAPEPTLDTLVERGRDLTQRVSRLAEELERCIAEDGELNKALFSACGDDFDAYGEARWAAANDDLYFALEWIASRADEATGQSTSREVDRVTEIWTCSAPLPSFAEWKAGAR